MKKELDEKLCNDYPKLFVNRHGDMRETAMCWGFECGDGWYPLINILCNLISWEIEDRRCPEVTVTQVKEKFGTLRFYYTGGNEVVDSYVTFAEHMSGTICEECGQAGKIRGGTWVKTLCDSHYKSEE